MEDNDGAATVEKKLKTNPKPGSPGEKIGQGAVYQGESAGKGRERRRA